ncbi:hypothetical protein PIB30_008606 [Stylosanthes scabra]|uniref:Uncharacterized protein n=1 Tax=Stylosanthes scabra TaxID=79078 RepID=A0ABU6R4J7_9FABA|nr:hypothetical protein [Stylosanthes scabra]
MTRRTHKEEHYGADEPLLVHSKTWALGSLRGGVWKYSFGGVWVLDSKQRSEGRGGALHKKSYSRRGTNTRRALKNKKKSYASKVKGRNGDAETEERRRRKGVD